MRLNPGNIVEAAALQAFRSQLDELRAIVVRESAGVDSPTRKLGAIDLVLNQHSALIAKLMRAARACHDRVLAADDGFRLLYSIFMNVILLLDWLQTASNFRKLPSGPPENRELSTAKTREAREQRLAMIKGRSKVAVGLIDELERIALLDPGVGPSAKQLIALLASLRIRVRCNEINATVIARDVGGRRDNLPDGALRLFRDELKSVAPAPEFQYHDDSAKYAVWQSLAIVCSRLGNVPGVAEAVTKRKQLAGSTLEDRIQAAVDALSCSTSDLERLSLVGELEQMEKSGELGTVYSRQRIGRVSMLRDGLAAIAPSRESG